MPDSLVTAGRVVRCARCGEDWAPVAATPVMEPEFSPAEPVGFALPETVSTLNEDVVRTSPRLSAMDRLAAQPVGRPPRTRVRLAWAASLVLLGLLVWGAFAWRSQVIAAWPPSTRMYAAFGLYPDSGSTR